MKTILRITYKDEFGNPQEAIVGEHNVIAIKEHPAGGEGDRWFYDIRFDGGDMFRVFDPVFVASEDITSETKGV